MTTRLESDVPFPPVVPDYALLRVIGRGAYGEVWLARGVTSLFRAVKIVRRSSFRDAGPYEREFEGVRKFAEISLGEPSQLALLHVGRNDAAGFFYYVMELADDVARGRDIDPATYAPHTLRELRRGPPQSVAKVLEIGVALARALASLHAHGLVHRDVKPSNVIFVGGVPKLADIGLVADPENDNTLVGTPGFISPTGANLPEGDVYALGKVLYELVTGLDRLQWPRLPGDLARREDRKALLELNEVLVRACEPDPRQRFRDAAALLAELRLVQAGSPLRPLKRQLRRALRASAVLAAVSAVALAGAWVQFKRAERAEAEREELRRRAEYRATIGNAQRAIEQENFGEARTWLEKVSPKSGESDLRGFEWKVLLHEAQGDPATIVRPAGGRLSRLRLSANGHWWALHSIDHSVEVRAGPTGSVRRTLTDILGVSGVSNDGHWLAGTTKQEEFRRWDLLEGSSTLIAPLVGRKLLGMDDTGSRVLTVDLSNPARGLVAETWLSGRDEPVARFPVRGSDSNRVGEFATGTVSADGRRLALATIIDSGYKARWGLHVVEPERGRELYAFTTPHRIVALAFSPDGNELGVSLGDTAEVGLLEVEAGRWRWMVPCGSGANEQLAFSPDGEQLAAGGREAVVRVLRTDSGAERGKYLGLQGGVQGLAWPEPEAAPLALGGSGELRQWRKDRGEAEAEEIRGLWQPAGGGRVLALSADGSFVAASDEPSRGAGVWRTGDGALLGRIPGAWFPLAFRGSDLVGVRADGVWEVRHVDQRMLKIAEAPESTSAESLGVGGFSADQRVLVCAAQGGELSAWDFPSRRVLARAKIAGGGVVAVAPRSDAQGAIVVSVDRRFHALQWNFETGELARALATGIVSVAVSADCRWAALGNRNGEVLIVALSDGHEIKRLQTDSGIVQSLALTRNGSRLAAGGTRGTVHLFATESWAEVATLRCAPRESSADQTVSVLAFSEDERVLAAYLNDGRIRLWRAESGR